MIILGIYLLLTVNFTYKRANFEMEKRVLVINPSNSLGTGFTFEKHNFPLGEIRYGLNVFDYASDSSVISEMSELDLLRYSMIILDRPTCDQKTRDDLSTYIPIYYEKTPGTIMIVPLEDDDDDDDDNQRETCQSSDSEEHPLVSNIFKFSKSRRENLYAFDDRIVYVSPKTLADPVTIYLNVLPFIRYNTFLLFQNRFSYLDRVLIGSRFYLNDLYSLLSL